MSEVSCFDLNNPPFCVVPGQPADRVAEEFLKAFETLKPRQDKVSLTFAELSQQMGVGDSTPLHVAGMRLSRSIDSGIGAGQGNAYHNPQHFCEVMLGAYFVALLDDLDTDSQLEVVLSALIHDFHHDGKANRQIPFRLERIAVNEAVPYLEEARVPEMQQRLVAALVLSTEVVSGLTIARACHAHHKSGSLLPDIHIAAPELALLAEHPLHARQALIVAEADVLPSIGLSIEHALQLQETLSMEWGIPLELEHKYRFITQAFPGFIIGTLFQPNVERLRQYLRQRIISADGS